MLAWIEANVPVKRGDSEITQWSAFRESAVPSDNESREYVSREVDKGRGAEREDIGTWFDYLDHDDLVIFGGKA